MPYGLGHFLFVFYALYTSSFTKVLYFFTSQTHSLLPSFLLTISLPPSFALSPPPLPVQVQCRCWCLSIMKRWEEEEESTLLSFLPGDELFTPWRRVLLHSVCAFLCVSVTACLNVVMLYLAVVSEEICFVSPWPHTHTPFWLLCKSFLFLMHGFPLVWQMLND